MKNDLYELIWSHHLCHPETCNHEFDFKVICLKTNKIIERGDDENYLLDKYFRKRPTNETRQETTDQRAFN